MIDSINGSFVTADLCLAVNNRLFLASVFTIQGQGPFRTLLFGLTKIEAQMVRTIINNEPPYHVSIEIKNTRLWNNLKTDKFFIQIIDKQDNAGNVTIMPTREE